MVSESLGKAMQRSSANLEAQMNEFAGCEILLFMNCR